MFLFLHKWKWIGFLNPWNEKVLQVNSSLYFAQFVQLVIFNIIREIRCELIYLFIHLINHLNSFWLLSVRGKKDE